MHRALCIVEVLQRVCECADDHTLTVMARSSRILHEPAIQTLWEVLPNLVPLAMCFPEDAWSVKEDTFSFTRTLSPEDWPAVLRYASYVRQLGQFYSMPARRIVAISLRLNLDAWEAMYISRPVQVLFPILRTLIWGNVMPDDRNLPSLLTCVGDELRELVVMGGFGLIPEARIALEEALQILILRAKRFTVLNRLVFYFGVSEHGISPTVVSMVSALLPTLPSLESLGCGCPLVDRCTIQWLATSPNLRNLTIHLPDDVSWSFNGDVQPFAILAQICITATAQQYIAFSKATKLPRVDSFELQIIEELPPGLIPELFISIRRQLSPMIVHDIKIYHEASGSDDAQAVVRPADLQPLLELRELRTIDLSELQCRFALDDKTFRDMAHAWPEITELYVALGERCVHDELPSVRALPPLAACCPHLKRLGLRFDSRRWETQAEFEADDASEDVYGTLATSSSTSGLETLQVGLSPIEATQYVVAFLRRIFPRLHTIAASEHYLWDDVEPETDARWHAVQDMLRLRN